ncbi:MULTISPECIES: D-amino-acid transaminase [Dickeya]|uniref:Aminodeoxychorismate lyase n=1 Tax=Dickeya fangzhongdai TaxID=1778540 RepID=A0A2K8QM86_9GAMM|nr:MULTISPECIES: D-amino-acid transaminase [Dickeya]ATZ93850.1 D-amino-acid transaminase [Dickeya fangzhongdai]AYH47482.1 D-amino acid aminotransferase [Dickeya fangzhongdai]MBO8134235.1 D-amino-acid transaminase [Dickeya fangzhongdai]QOH47285.1 D-amino-acid transaminase [Dickeya fangzhongdai]QOH51591.1 D-amino-acid transaminase [Dickeya fangzhongdai]
MSRILYVNGRYLPEEQATISVFDRGFLFADAVYEVTAVVNGRLAEYDGHMARLARSCRELNLRLPVSPEELHHIHLRLIEQNRLEEGGIYLQLSRGSTGDRDFAFPTDAEPTLVLFTQSRPVLHHPSAEKGIRVITCPDLRWHRRDIKTVSLLMACMAKEWAHAKGADDAWLVENGLITEGSSSNCFIVDADNRLITRPLSNDILHGITRKALLQLAADHHLTVEERAFTPQEALAAKEAFISSATTFVWPVVEIDGVTIGDGRPGPLARQLRDIYIGMIRAQTAG